MANQTIEDMVCEVHREEVWEQIKTKTDVDVDLFISNEGYPDEYTHRLAAAASEISHTHADETLVALGENWVLRASLGSYGELRFFPHNGTIFVPSFINKHHVPGMHGFDPQAPHSAACWLTNHDHYSAPKRIEGINDVMRLAAKS